MATAKLRLTNYPKYASATAETRTQSTTMLERLAGTSADISSIAALTKSRAPNQ